MVAVPSKGRADLQAHAPEAEVVRSLFEEYGRQLYAFCFSRLRSREEAEDAVQSTFLNAFRALQRDVAPTHEAAWLYKIAENVCLTRVRSSTRRRRVETPGDLEAISEVVPAHEPETEELANLPQALESMPEQQRRALLLREWQGLSYREIADEMELSQSAVETLLFRARRTLAAGLETEEPKRGKLARLRSGSDAGAIVALLKTLLFSGGAKVVIVGAVAATSVVGVSPGARHTIDDLFVPHMQAAAPAVHHTAAKTKPKPPAVPHVVTSASVVSAPAVVQRVAPTRPVHVAKKTLHDHPAATHHVAKRHFGGHARHHQPPAPPPVAPPVPAVTPVQPAIVASQPSVQASTEQTGPQPEQTQQPASPPAKGHDGDGRNKGHGKGHDKSHAAVPVPVPAPAPPAPVVPPVVPVTTPAPETPQPGGDGNGDQSGHDNQGGDDQGGGHHGNGDHGNGGDRGNGGDHGHGQDGHGGGHGNR